MSNSNVKNDRYITYFFHKAITEVAKFDNNIRLLDFGCGEGWLIKELRNFGYDVYGTDTWLTYNEAPNASNLKKINLVPYKLPFENNYFDIIISTSVLEHAMNTDECFKEMYRILKPGGYAMHIFPGKWYVPKEPHIYVPLVNWLWPYCPKWWLALWALFGVRNEFQKGKNWKEVYEINAKYVKNHLCYRSSNYYKKLSIDIFGNCSWPMVFYINNAVGGFSNFFKKLPFKSLSGLLSREFRMGFLVVKKN